MYKRWLNVIVVDDELPLRQELRSFPWAEWGAVLAGEAENGTEALQLCRDSVPDVVVTDITMPLMNGLELTEHIRREFPAVQVILLTCHSDFHYAREALKLGALEYLVKVTLEEEELERAIARAREAIEREWAHRKSALEQRRREQSKVIGRLLKDKLGEEPAMVAELVRCGLLQQLPARLVMLKVQSSEEDRVYVEQELQTVLEELETTAGPSFCWVPVSGAEYAVFFQGEQLPVPQLKLRLEAIIRSLTQALDDNLPFLAHEVDVYGVISESLASGSEFRRAFGQIKLWQEAKFYESEAPQSIFVGKPVALTALDKSQAAQLHSQLHRAAGEDSEALSLYIQTELVRDCLKHRYRPEELKQLVSSFLEEYAKGEPAGGHELQDVRDAATLSQLSAAAVRFIRRKHDARGRLRKEVLEAKQYIAEHLADPITLHLLAEQVGLSPHYISKLFREEVGESVNEYMTRLRMERAVQLLQETNLKVYEVADRVGIPSYRYFTTMFRSRTGVSPTDYKRQQGGQVWEEGGEPR
ncbi:two-component system, response regulator YesN [Paenibacillus sp. UNCCL117]|uniref:response regulator n=1 Tax=unclassified Paenibacillus TaxID=185978 RepID=UPI00088BE23D|nr:MULTISPECIES: response regulator [unclassified Paenibacillus]SDC92940.1 two-component system, response regulator YesN [Paenibacillus sp. cl123]SFW29442.1 two-component system, response regulator YesN [Paenibacillus sp. UNCCL117]